VDNCCMQLVSKPEQFDVMVCKSYPFFFNLWWSKQIGLQFILSGQLCCIRVLVKKTTTQSYYEPILVFPFFYFHRPWGSSNHFSYFLSMTSVKISTENESWQTGQRKTKVELLV
jgi:hypothetical protein